MHRLRRVPDDGLVADGLDHHGLRRPGERVRHEAVGAGRQILEELPVPFVRDEREPFRNRRPDAGRMVEVMMRDDRPGQRLVGPELTGTGDHGQRARLVLGHLDESRYDRRTRRGRCGATGPPAARGRDRPPRRPHRPSARAAAPS